MRVHQLIRLAAGLLLVGGLAGCVSSEHDDLNQWMVDQRQQIKPRVTPISEPKQYVPASYVQAQAADPFGSERLTQALRRDSSSRSDGAALVASELNRRKEPLEAYPLDTMTMVGSLLKGKQLVGLVKVDNLLYQVRPGNYLGQNYGRITGIDEGQITLREIVQDAAGEWIERVATLQLQESSK